MQKNIIFSFEGGMPFFTITYYRLNDGWSNYFLLQQTLVLCCNNNMNDKRFFGAGLGDGERERKRERREREPE